MDALFARKSARTIQSPGVGVVALPEAGSETSFIAIAIAALDGFCGPVERVVDLDVLEELHCDCWDGFLADDLFCDASDVDADAAERLEGRAVCIRSASVHAGWI